MRLLKSHQRLLFHLLLAVVLPIVITTIGAVAVRLAIGTWPWKEILLKVFLIQLVFYTALAVYDYLEEEYII